MFETAITIWETATKVHDVYKRVNTIIFGDKKEQYLQQIATDMTDLKVHIEKLSDTLLYAVNLDGIRAAQQPQQQYINDLREIRQLLEPLQQALQQPLLSSAMIAAPRPLEELKQLRQELICVAPLEYVTIPANWDGVPVLFQENGEYWVGWQSPAQLSEPLGCHYQPQWQPNQNQLPPAQHGTGRIIIQNGKIQEQSPPSQSKQETTKPKTPAKPPKSTDKITPKTDTSAKHHIFRDRLTGGSEGPEMVWIAAGTFRMGDIRGVGGNDEKPVHKVSVERFAIGRYPVTFAEYDQFAKATNRKKPDDRGWGRDNRPVIMVNLTDVVAYIEWLSEQTKQQYRLPTEAQWEYAARAGTETDYSWGNDIGKNRANCDGSGSQWSDKQTSPVGSFEPNPFGLYDTVGNVWEWTCSKYEDSYQGAEQHCLSKDDGSRRVVRGGSWYSVPSNARVSDRARDDWNVRDGNDVLGFRVVRI